MMRLRVNLQTMTISGIVTEEDETILTNMAVKAGASIKLDKDNATISGTTDQQRAFARLWDTNSIGKKL